MFWHTSAADQPSQAVSPRSQIPMQIFGAAQHSLTSFSELSRSGQWLFSSELNVSQRISAALSISSSELPISQNSGFIFSPQLPVTGTIKTLSFVRARFCAALNQNFAISYNHSNSYKHFETTPKNSVLATIMENPVFMAQSNKTRLPD
jgi:hypothetical protein